MTMALMPQPDITPDTADQRSWPNPRRAWTVALLLSLASIASQFDRVVLNLTVEPVKAEFGLDDTSFALLQGVAFGIFYTLGAVPLGRLADRYERRIVLGISLFFFSLASMASGLSRNFSQLFLSRVAVGCGEASVTPSGLSLLSDLFPPEKLGRAVSVFFLSAPFGIGLAFMAGGKLLQWLTERWHGSGLPFGLEPWQAAFLIVGAPGLLLAPLLLFMKEPERRGPGGAAPLSIAEVLGVIRARRRALILMFAGFSMVTVVNFAYNVWTPALFARVYGWTPAQVGIGFGLIMMICGTGGTYFAGWLSDRLTRAGHVDAHLRVAAFGFLACGIFGTLAPLMPNAWAALALIAPAMFLSCMPVPCAGTALQLILPNRARGQVTALYIMVISLVGIGIGPVVIGFMTDHLFTAPTDIRYSLAIVVGCAAPIMCVLLLLALKPYRALRLAGLEG
ncbi:MFS transporter [Sphingobium sp. WCS2017Hpa-17]|uniref:spinster family MFS transporter n=1 Tax=Sphingobium sp. WCS2017Hpa-17 TaxID=3073638 RepID=UPI00288BCB01|nr:MFS transporter [Sphingobium sp. WCS2017Hpa-17]